MLDKNIIALYVLFLVYSSLLKDEYIWDILLYIIMNFMFLESPLVLYFLFVF